MFKATEKMFLNVLFSGIVVEIHIYCEDDIIYYWTDSSSSTISYLMSPRTGVRYNEFKDNLKKTHPLLMELV